MLFALREGGRAFKPKRERASFSCQPDGHILNSPHLPVNMAPSVELAGGVSHFFFHNSQQPTGDRRQGSPGDLAVSRRVPVLPTLYLCHCALRPFLRAQSQAFLRGCSRSQGNTPAGALCVFPKPRSSLPKVLGSPRFVELAVAPVAAPLLVLSFGHGLHGKGAPQLAA